MNSLRIRIAGSALLYMLTAGSAILAAGPADPSTVDRFYPVDDQLRGLIGRLLASNPAVRSAWADSRSGYHRVEQAVALPDPEVAYRWFAASPETRVGPQQHGLEISQGLPWRSKRQLQGEQARLLADGSTWRARDRERAEVARLKNAYFEAAYLQEAITLLDEERSLLQRFEQIALTRYATGKGIQQDVVKVQTEISRLDEQEVRLGERLTVLRHRMAESVGSPGTGLELSPIALPFPEFGIRAETLEALAVEQHPAVRGMESRIEAGRTRTRRRELDKRPDFKVGLGYTLVGTREDPAGILAPPPDNGDDILGVTVGVRIPLYRKRIRAGIAEAQLAVDRDLQALQAVRNDLRFQVQEAVTRLESIGERGRMYDTVIIPQAEQALASAEAAYQTGNLGFLDLLDAQRILFRSRLEFHRLVSDYWSATVELEEAIGRPFPLDNEGSSR